MPRGPGTTGERAMGGMVPGPLEEGLDASYSMGRGGLMARDRGKARGLYSSVLGVISFLQGVSFWSICLHVSGYQGFAFLCFLYGGLGRRSLLEGGMHT